MVTELRRETQTGVEQSQALHELQAWYDRAHVQSQARERVLLDRIAADCARLQSAADAKDVFLDTVSHELRTPLTVIRGDAEILLRPATALDEEMRFAALTDIAAESDRMSHILENLVILARPELSTVAFSEPCNLVRFVERAKAEHGRRFPERSLKVEHDKRSIVVDCVETYLDQVLQNLLSNAEKYSPPCEPIIVRITASEAQVRVCVLDSGKGFTADEASRVFEAFFRIKDERSHRPGLGIGLSVCKRLVEVMGGSIWAGSRPEGGAEVGFSLPLDGGVGQADNDPEA